MTLIRKSRKLSVAMCLVAVCGSLLIYRNYADGPPIDQAGETISLVTADRFARDLRLCGILHGFALRYSGELGSVHANLHPVALRTTVIPSGDFIITGYKDDSVAWRVNCHLAVPGSGITKRGNRYSYSIGNGPRVLFDLFDAESGDKVPLSLDSLVSKNGVRLVDILNELQTFVDNFERHGILTRQKKVEVFKVE